MAAPPALAESAADAAIRQAQGCSNGKAVKYSRETAESAQTIAEAAFDACESLWRVDGRAAWRHGIPFTENSYGLRGRPEAEIKRLQVQVLETRANGNK